MSDWNECKPINICGHLARVFQKNVGDGHLSVFVALEPLGPDNELRWHLSISHRSNNIVLPSTGKPAPGRIPTWEEIKEARYRFLPDDVYMAMILPPMSEYVNVHPTTMHLHEISEKDGQDV